MAGDDTRPSVRPRVAYDCAMNRPITPSATPANGSKLKGVRGWQRFAPAIRYSVDGLAAAWKHENAFRQEVVGIALLAPLAVLLPFSVVERVLLLGVLALVLIVELLNSAIEAAIDRDSLRIDPLAKRAKDIGSAAVLLALLTAAGTWLAIFAARFL